MLQQARTALAEGDFDRARDLLTRLLKANPNNSEYWVWMSAAVETRRETVYCLKEARRLDPKNDKAERGLILFGELPLNKKYIFPYSKQKRKWKTALPLEPPPSMRIAPGVLLQLPLVAGGAVILIILLVIGIFGAGSIPPFLGFLWPTPTYSIGLEKVPTFSGQALYTPTFTRQTPLSAALKATYTATPLAVRTQHSGEDFRLAMQSYKQGDWAAAEVSLKKAITNEPSSADLYYYLGEVARFQEKYTQALQAYQQAEEINPGFAPAHLGTARALLASNPAAWAKARSELEKAIELDPALAEAYLELAAIDLQQGDAGAALQHLAPAAILLPDSALFYYYRSQAHLGLDKLQPALEDARRANQLDFTLLPVYRLLGQLNLMTGDAASAVEALGTYTLYSPQDAEALTWLGSGYAALGQTALAIDAFGRALRVDNNYVEAYMQRGQLYFSLKKYDLARADFVAAVSLKTDYFPARMALARCLLEQAQYTEAINQLNIAASLAGDDTELAQVYYQRALAREKKGNPVDAYRDWQSLAQLPPGSAPDEWMRQAQQRIASLATRTPTPLTPTMTSTRQPTRTLRPSATRQPTRTFTPSPTSKPTRTPTPRPPP